MLQELKKSSGFTFVELVLAMAIFSMVLLIITSGTIQLYKIYQAGLGIRSTQQVGRAISDDISRTGREAAAYEISAVAPTKPVATTMGVVNSPQHTVCYFSSSFRRRGTIFYTVAAGGNQYNFMRATIANPTPLPANTCNIANVVPNTQVRLNSAATSVLRFNAVPEPGLAARMMTYELVVAASTSIRTADLERIGADNIFCVAQAGSQFCSITRLNGGSALRLFQ